MQVKHSELNASLKEKCFPLYLIHGDDYFLMQEIKDKLLYFASRKGYLHREIIFIESPSDWSKLTFECENFSLFNEKRVFDIINPSANLDKTAQAVLTDYLKKSSDDEITIVSTHKLSASQKKTSWFQMINKAGVIISVWPLQKNEYLKWIAEEFKKYDLQSDKQTINLLAEYTEGNLLAAKQAIQKLKLLYPSQSITENELKLVISNSSTYKIFDLIDCILSGNSIKTKQMLFNLHQQEIQPTLLLWLLAKEIRKLLNIKKGFQYENLYTKQYLVEQAVSRLSYSLLTKLLAYLTKVDQIIKGYLTGDAWSELEKICLMLSCGYPFYLAEENNVNR